MSSSIGWPTEPLATHPANRRIAPEAPWLILEVMDRTVGSVARHRHIRQLRPRTRGAADAGVPAGTLHAIAARVPAETLTAAAPVAGPEGSSRTARSAAEE